MATIALPITLDPTAPPVVASATLDGAEYLIRVAYNERDAAWYMSVSTTDDVLLVGSQPLIDGWPLLSPYKRTDARIPQGDLWLVGSALTYTEAG